MKPAPNSGKDRLTQLMPLCIFALIMIGLGAWWAVIENPREIEARPGEGAIQEDEASKPVGQADAGNELPRTRASVAHLGQVPPMPALDLPLAEQWDALVARAESGDTEARCRIVVESLNCLSNIRRQEFMSALEDSLANDATRNNEGRAIDMIAGTELRDVDSRSHCVGMDAEKIRNVLDQNYGADARLNPRQKVVIAMTRPDDSMMRLPRPHESQSRVYDLETVYPQYLADHQYEYLQVGIAAAEPLALEGMLLVHAPTWMPGLEGVSLSMPDPKKFVYYAHLMQRLYGDVALGEHFLSAVQRSMSQMSPAELRDIDNEVDRAAQAWQARSFARTNDRAASKWSERASHGASLCSDAEASF